MDRLVWEINRLFVLPGNQSYHVQNRDGDYPPSPPDWPIFLSTTVLKQHLAGAETVALNLVSAEGLSRAMMLDFDGAAHGQAARDWRTIRRVVRDIALPELGLPI